MEAVPLAVNLLGGGGVGGEAVEVGPLPINLGGVGYYCRNKSTFEGGVYYCRNKFTFEGWGGVGGTTAEISPPLRVGVGWGVLLQK